MSIESITRQLQAVRHPVSSSLTLPPGCYHDPAWLELEIQRLFSAGWVGIGRADQWKEPGDYDTLQIGAVRLVVVMDNERKLRALSNVCLHRASLIMQGAGNCRALVCPFHGWSYDYRGKVISAPRMESADDFNADKLRLKEFHLEVRDGFVFINLADEPASLDDWLGDFPDMHRNWSLGELVTGRRRVMDVNCNWKLFLEVFNEYYHLPHVHPQSIDHYYPEPDPTDPVIGEYTTQFGETTANPALLEDDQSHALPLIPGLDEREQNGARYTWVYPNLTFAAGMDCLWMYHVYPLSANRTRAVQTICFPPESAALDHFQETAQAYYARFDFAIDEDIPALETQQSGLESPHATQGRFSTLEPSVANFACWYAEVMGGRRTASLGFGLVTMFTENDIVHNEQTEKHEHV